MLISHLKGHPSSGGTTSANAKKEMELSADVYDDAVALCIHRSRIDN